MTSADVDEDDKWSQYPDTVLEFYADGPGRVDLRRPLGRAERETLARIGLAGPFAVLTAENPEGDNAEDADNAKEQRREAERNDRRMSALVRELTRRGQLFVRVDGVSPDGSYRERCVAVPIARAEAVALARDFAQLALFWYDGDRFWLLPAAANRPPRPLPP